MTENFPFYSRLKAARRAMRLRHGQRATQIVAAARIGCPVATLQDWESGRRVPSGWVQELVLGALAGRRTRAKGPVKAGWEEEKGNHEATLGPDERRQANGWTCIEKDDRSGGE